MRKGGSAGTIAALALACVFGVTMLLSLAAGAGVYRQVAGRVETGSADRTGMSYLISRLRSYDSRDMVATGSFGDGDALFLYEDVEGVQFETVIYVADGWLRELVCEPGHEPVPQDGQTISESGGLSITEENNLLRLKFTGADGKTEEASVYMRAL